MRRIYFGGATGPEASGGPMAIAVVFGDARSMLMNKGVDSSWHSATYHALAWAFEHLLESPGWDGRGEVEFATDNEMVIAQMQGWRRVKKGRYVEAWDDAVSAMVKAFPYRDGPYPRFIHVPFHENPAASEAIATLRRIGIEAWSYKKTKEPVT